MMELLEELTDGLDEVTMLCAYFRKPGGDEVSPLVAENVLYTVEPVL